MKLTTKQIIIIVSIALVMITFIIVAVWAYRKGKKKTTIAVVPFDVPSGANNSAGVSSAEIYSISDALFKDMDGFNLSGHDVEPFQRLNALSDTDFVHVYNAFNTQHQDEGDGTLKEWIESESFAFDDVVESILDRMGRLNLK